MRLRAALIFAALVLSGCTVEPSGTSVQSATESPAASPTPSTSATDEPTEEPSRSPRPESATDMLECDGQVSMSGGLAFEFGPEGSGATPDEAFATWVDVSSFVVPRTGYRELGSLGDRHVWVYEVEDEVKVVVTISPRYGELAGGVPFTIEELRMCELAEFGPSVDLGPFHRVWTHETTGFVITDIVGSSHCGYESARLLHVNNPDGSFKGQYVRDPLGVLAGFVSLRDTYAEVVVMPGDATFSGYRSSAGEGLWFTLEDRAAYVVRADGIVERWPRAEPPIACA